MNAYDCVSKVVVSYEKDLAPSLCEIIQCMEAIVERVGGAMPGRGRDLDLSELIQVFKTPTRCSDMLLRTIRREDMCVA